ncbi:4-amino-4-deoxy-L-arabinose transferase and related glycosyltransferases of PMT family [Richelia intracellularis]|nr:4-amino-4-deoxy-L-arabinose transferase and related glycosyltransferases of PMT family [Richelia intracellularis]
MSMKSTFAHNFQEWLHNLDKRPSLLVVLSVLWILVICVIGFFWHLGSTGLVDETEPLFAEASRQMVVTGNWITPYFNGETRFDKPALIYWCQAIAYKIIGVNEWAVRLPSAFAAMVLTSLSFYTVYQYAEPTKNVSLPHKRWIIAVFATILMAFCPEMVVWGRIGVSDMLLTGFTSCTLLCFFWGYANPPQSKGIFPSPWYIACYLCAAGGVLTKGPIGFVLPGLVVLVFLLYVGKFWQIVREMKLFIGLPIVISLSLPWYILVFLQNGQKYIDSFFGYHNFERFTDVVNGHSAPWYFYFVVVLLGFAPYSVYLPIAIAKQKFWQRRHWSNRERSQQFGLFTCVWFFVVFGFFTIAVTKLPSYVLPLMPAAAILVALFWGKFMDDSTTPSISLQVTAWVNVSFVTVIAIALFYVTRIMGSDPAAPEFRATLQESGITTVGGLIWAISALVLAFAILRRVWVYLMGINLFAFALFLLFVLTPAQFLMDSQRQLPLRKVAYKLAQEQKPGEEIVMVGFKKPTAVFYSHRSITYFTTTPIGKEYLQQKKSQPPEIKSLLLISQPKKYPEMGLQPSDYEVLEQKGAYKLARVSLP